MMDLSKDTLRHYEKVALIKPVQRSSGGQRRYPPGDLDWLGRHIAGLNDTIDHYQDLLRERAGTDQR